MSVNRVLVIGRSGQVARALLDAAWPKQFVVEARGREALDLTDASAVAASVAGSKWSAVINAAAYTAVDKAESEPEAAFALNANGPAALAEACASHDVPLVHLSTDYVFDGRKAGAYLEDDEVNPLSVYGASKSAGELCIRDRHDKHVIIRTSWVYSAGGQNFVRTMLRLGADRDALSIVADQHGRPTAATDIANAVIAVVEAMVAGEDDRFGTFHFAGAGETTWHGFAAEIFRQAAVRAYRKPPTLRPISTSDYPTPAARPLNSVLDTSKIESLYGIHPRPWAIGLSETLDQLIGRTREPIA